MKCTGYPLHSPVSPSLPLPCVTVCYHVSTGLYNKVNHIFYQSHSVVINSATSVHKMNTVWECHTIRSRSSLKRTQRFKCTYCCRPVLIVFRPVELLFQYIRTMKNRDDLRTVLSDALKVVSSLCYVRSLTESLPR